MTEKEKFDLIDRYFRGELSEKEKEFFNSKWATDSDFADEVANHEIVNEFILDAGLLGIKDKLNNIHHSNKMNGKNGKLKKGTIIGSITAIIAVLGFWAISGSNNGNPTGNETQAGNKPDVEQSASNENPAKKSLEPKDQGVENPNNDPSLVTKKPENNQPDNNQKQVANAEENTTSSREGNNSKKSDKNTTEKSAPANKQQTSNDNKSGNRDSENIGTNRKEVQKSSPGPNTGDSMAQNTNVNNNPNASPCNETEVTVSTPKVIKTCEGKQNGKIILDTNTIYGGKPPYKYGLDKSDKFTSDPYFTKLRSGHYSVNIVDANGCTGEINVHVPAKDCNQKAGYVFVPEEEEAWNFPFEDQAVSGQLEIYTKEGRKIYQERINNGIPGKWNGRSNDGKPQPMGLYHVVFKKASGITKTWNLTIIR